MLSEEEVTITIIITSKVTGKTTIISVPNSRQPTYDSHCEKDDDLIPLEVKNYVYKSAPRMTSVSFTFYPESDNGEGLFTVFNAPIGG